MSDEKLNRRETLTGLVAAAGLSGSLRAATPVQQRTLGRTGQKVSCLGMGGFHIGKPRLSDDEAIRLIHQAIDHGLNFMDNSWDYKMGKARSAWARRFAASTVVRRF